MISGTVLPEFLSFFTLLDCLSHQNRLATETGSALARLLDPIHLPFTANVVLELCDQRKDSHDELSGAVNSHR
jgi:hypothetical protein